VAQIGAAIGREFSYELIDAVAGGNERELRNELARLVASELVFQRGTSPESVYTFKHALAQDAAYWPAPGSEDTELRCLMEQEAGHGEATVYAGVQA
jgi:predicted ATPase